MFARWAAERRTQVGDPVCRRQRLRAGDRRGGPAALPRPRHEPRARDPRRGSVRALAHVAGCSRGERSGRGTAHGLARTRVGPRSPVCGKFLFLACPDVLASRA